MSEHVDTLNRMLQRCDEHEAPALQAAIRALANTEIRIPAGTLISVDVSEGDDDAENRVFARATGEVMPYHEPVILSIEEERNFDQGQGTPASHNPPTLPVVGTTIGQATFVEGYGMVELGGGAAAKLSPPITAGSINDSVLFDCITRNRIQALPSP